jgi:voltage-gated potassium channel
MKNHVIVCGYGRIGRRVVEDLRHNGEAAVVVEKEPEKIDALKSNLIPCVSGDAIDLSVLRQAGIDQAASLVVALPDHAAAMLVTLLARKANEHVRIIARCDADVDHQALRAAGADLVVSPLEMVAERMALSAVDANALGYVRIEGDSGQWLRVDQVLIVKGSILCDHTVSDNSVFAELDLLLVGIRKASGNMLFKPRSSERFETGDTLVVVGTSVNLGALKQMLRSTTLESNGRAGVRVASQSQG